MGFVENIWGFRAFVVLWHWCFKREWGKVLTENCGCFKQLAYISLLESINVNLLQLLFWAKQNCILVGLVLLLDADSCCTASKCLSLMGIAVLHQTVWWSQGSCPDLHSLPAQRLKQSWRPCANQCGGLPFRKVSTCNKPGKKKGKLQPDKMLPFESYKAVVFS